ncbi:MAG: molecular chaperone DnaK [Robiginitomaculum sp.]|nr:MAG: molecular chaperone DnaK [Robiginitomaculum sp.]
MESKTAKYRLNEMKSELEMLSQNAEANRKPIALDQQSVGRLSRMDSLQIQAMDQAAETQRRKRILRIDAALVRIETGDFGYCATCEEPISEKRLEFDPSIPLCIECARG